jgi:hypothetical protein
MDEQNVTVKIDVEKLSKTKLGVIRRLTKEAGIDAIYAFLSPLVEGGEATLDELEIGQLKFLVEQLKGEIEKLGNAGN